MSIAGDQYYHFLEGLMKKQVRLYPDACDLGVKVNPQMKARVGWAVNGLKGIYKVQEEQTWSTGKSIAFQIPFEQDEGRYQGVILRVIFSIDRIRKFQSVSIELSRFSSSESGFLSA